MISPSDEDYLLAKELKLGRRKLEAPFADLITWMQGWYRGVAVLDVQLNSVEVLSRAGGWGQTLSVVLEHEADLGRFLTGMNFNEGEQQRVRAQFARLAAPFPRINASNAGVVFSAFEAVARVEANWRVSAADIEEVTASLALPELWLIRPSWATVGFFFHTEAQRIASERSGVRERCLKAYSEMLGRYDEFGYFRDRPIQAAFDSNENFQKAYGGSWFAYDR